MRIILLLTIMPLVIMAGRFVQPEPYTVITADRVRLQVEVPAETRYCRFYAIWTGTDTVMIGADSAEPFEIVWNCEDIPDRYFGKGSIFCLAEGKNRKITLIEPDRGCLIVLDRNRELNDLTVISEWVGKAPVIDGVLNEWGDIAAFPLVLKGSDNLLQAKSLWDDSFLYFAVKIKDAYLLISQDMDSVPFLELWESDNVELSFDLKHDHNSIARIDDRELLVIPDGRFQGTASETAADSHLVWSGQVRCSVRIEGTINDFTYKDSGYAIEIAIPWQSLGVKPVDGFSMGFDIFNGDFDGPGGQQIRTTWSGVKIPNNDNPSEWGNLVLEKRGRSGQIVTGFIMLCIIIGCVVYRRKKVKNDISPSQKEIKVKQAKAYIAGHFPDVDLTLQKVADALNMNKSYLSAVFKEVEKENFVRYLNKIRIEAAKRELAETDNSITGVAFNAGYNSLDYFIRIFKSHTSQTPLEFRKKSQK